MLAPRFVLLASPLLGPMAWQAVSAELVRRGRAATAPAWPPLSSISEGFYGALASGLVESLGTSREQLLLVAHSGAGALAPVVADRLAGSVAGVILVDAILPHPGRSWFDTAPAEMRDRLRAGAQMGELPSWDEWWPPGALERLVPEAAIREALVAELEPLPVAYFEEGAPPAILAAPTAYLQLSGAYDDEGKVAGRYGWPLVRLPLHHLAMLTDPEPVASALESLAARLAGPTMADAAATEVWFYHLERTGLEQALPELLEKTLQRGWKAMVRVRDVQRLQHLDSWLWTYRDESFLPHTPDDEPGASRQPILLTTGFENANGADALFLVDGAEPGELSGYARCVVLFDGGDEGQLAVARAQWSAVKATGVQVSYWKQQARGWQKQA